LAAANSKLEALGKVWVCDSEELSPQEPNNKFSVTKDDKERTACHVVAKMGNVNILKKLWEWAKGRQTVDELEQTLFLAKHLMGRTAW